MPYAARSSLLITLDGCFTLTSSVANLVESDSDRILKEPEAKKGICVKCGQGLLMIHHEHLSR